MKLVMIKIIFKVLLVPNKRVFRIQVNYVRCSERIGFCNTGNRQQVSPVTQKNFVSEEVMTQTGMNLTPEVG